MDAADQAQIVSDQWLSGQIHRRRTAREAARTAGVLECVDCGEAIAAARRAAVPEADRCVECQSRAETRRP